MRAGFLLAAALILTPACAAEKPVKAELTPEAKPGVTSQISQLEPEIPASQSAQPQAQFVAKKTYGEPKVPYGLRCKGVAKQGGMMVCRTSPNSKVTMGRSVTRSDAKGNVILGFDRDAPALQSVSVTRPDGKVDTHKLPLEARTYSEQRIDGLPPSQVDEYTAEDLKKIRAATARKKVGFASNQETIYFQDGFDYPIKDFVKTSPFGSRRILNGEPKSPHYGVDIAAPLGTPIYAPADGVVSLADENMYFEGALVMIDHGQGLNSLYLHVNDVFVETGQFVKRGEKIAEVGSKGRSTGPHLCWRLKWKKENLDPELLTQWPGR